MCFYAAQAASIEEVEERFQAQVDHPENFLQSDYIVGFAYQNVPIILDKEQEIIQTSYHWGLLPTWASKDKDKGDFRKNTLNARIETAEEKPSFKNVTNNRCLVIGTSFFEWRHENEGKTKIKHQIHNQDNEIFAFGGLYGTWADKVTGEIYNSFTIMTMDANESMRWIHNSKERMPLMLNKEDEKAWLDSSNKLQDFMFPNYQPRLIGFPI